MNHQNIDSASSDGLQRMNVFSQDYLESLYRDFLQNPDQVPIEWQEFFRNQESVEFRSAGVSQSTEPRELTASEMGIAQLQDRVDQLVRGFRVRGHLEANIDPLGMPRPGNRELNPDSYGLLPGDMQKKFSARTIYGDDYRTLEEIVDQLRHTYCRSIGAQFMHIDDHHVR